MEPGRRTRLALTGGDIEVFRWLWMLRVMTLEQIRRTRYYQPETGRLSSADNVRKRLKRLWDAGYLVGDTLRPGNERIYFLGQEALAPLNDQYGIGQRRLYRPRSSETMRQLQHPLMVSECAIRITESIRGTEVETPELAPLWVPFYHTHAVGDSAKKKHVERFVTQEDIRAPAQSAPLRVRPDLVFALAKGSSCRLFFLEADRGSESANEIAAKQVGYHHYLRARDPQDASRLLWQRYGDAADFRVLFVTTHARRIEYLRRSLGEKPGFDLSAFTTFEKLQVRNPVFEPVWKVGVEEMRALVRSTR